MKRLYFLLTVCALTAAASAQSITIQSQVKATNGQPVQGAIVSLSDGSKSVLSDEQGSFTLAANEGEAVVSIKAEGYYEKTLPLSLLRQKAGNASFTITLTPENERLYSGTAQTPWALLSGDARSPMTASMESKDFNTKLSVGAATRDALPGLQIIEKSGMPGEGTYMNVRGIHTFTADNAPLIVINGIPYMGNADVSAIINGYSRDQFFGYSPRDIRSITLLKGADAAFYGSLGSNGVLLIETQQATSDNLDTRISFSGQYGVNFHGSYIPVMNATQYRKYMGSLGLTAYPSMATLTNDYPFLQNGTNPYSYLFNEDTDWMKDIHRQSFQTENIFRVEGGDEIAKYNISFGYTNNVGTLKGTESQRYHTLISSDVMVSRKFDITTNVALAYITSDLQNTGMQMQTNPILAAYHNMPLINAHAKQDDGSVLGRLAAYDAWNVSSIPTLPYDNVSNAMAIVNTVEGGDKIYDANAGVGLHYKWNDWLKLSALVNLYYNYTEETMFVPGMSNATILPQAYGIGKNQVAEGVIRQQVNTYSLQGQYTRTFNHVHELNALALARVLTRDIETDVSQGYNTANDYYKTLDNTSTEKYIGGSQLKWNYLGFALHGDYIYNRLFKGSLGLTVDGTSVSGSDASRFGFFPSAGITGMLANTGKLPSWISRLNLSLEASLTGNSRFSPTYGRNTYEGTNAFELGSIVQKGMANTRITWEKQRQLDFGIDLSLLGGLADLTASVFTNESYDLLLVGRSASSVFGNTSFYDNLGSIRGKGLELGLRLNPIHTKDFDFTLGATFTTVSNKVHSLGGDQQMVLGYNGYANDDATMVMAVDHEPYEFYGYETRGIFSTTADAQAANLRNVDGVAYEAGDVWFVDQNGDGIIDSKDKVSLGSPLPQFYGGVNLSVRYKEFVLDANFGYSVGAKLYNGTRRQVESMDKFYNQSTAVLNRWQIEGQEATLPRATYGDPKGNNLFSDRWIEKGDYLKLRSVRLTYNFEKLFSLVRSGSVFVAAENLFTLTKYLGSDPEFAYSYDERLRGFDYAKVTLPITAKVGFNLNF